MQKNQLWGAKNQRMLFTCKKLVSASHAKSGLAHDVQRVKTEAVGLAMQLMILEKTVQPLCQQSGAKGPGKKPAMTRGQIQEP